MKELEIIVPIVAAIMGVAYPIILQTVSTLDERYNTTDIVTYFKNETIYNSFRCFLFLDLIALGTVLLNMLFGFLTSHYLELITFLLILLTIVLVICFLLLVRRLKLYYSKEKLIQYLIKLDKKAQKKGNYKYFNTLTDIFCWAIKNEIVKIPETLHDYFFSCFKNYGQDQ